MMQIRLAERRGILRGDLNYLQNLALQVAISEEERLTGQIEENRMRYTILSTNPQLYGSVFRDDAIIDEDEEGVEWITPDSAEDIDFILQDYARVQRESSL